MCFCRLLKMLCLQVRTLIVGGTSRSHYRFPGRGHNWVNWISPVKRSKWASANCSRRSWGCYWPSLLEVTWNVCGYCSVSLSGISKMINWSQWRFLHFFFKSVADGAFPCLEESASSFSCSTRSVWPEKAAFRRLSRSGQWQGVLTSSGAGCSWWTRSFL